ncbi:MAG: hypothetical protein WKG00_00095 [Polyangiaceae bacterium]
MKRTSSRWMARPSGGARKSWQCSVSSPAAMVVDMRSCTPRPSAGGSSSEVPGGVRGSASSEHPEVARTAAHEPRSTVQEGSEWVGMA